MSNSEKGKPDLEIAEEQYMAIVMDLYERIAELEAESGGGDTAMLGQVERCLKNLGVFVDLPDLQAHGEEFYLGTYGALCAFRKILKPRPDTQDAESGGVKCDRCQDTGYVLTNARCPFCYNQDNPDTDIKMKPKHSYDVKLKIESWEKGKLMNEHTYALRCHCCGAEISDRIFTKDEVEHMRKKSQEKADKPSDEARKITAKVRRKLGITDREFDALLQKLKEGKPSMGREDYEASAEAYERGLKDAQPLSVGREEIVALLDDIGTWEVEFDKESYVEIVKDWLTALGVEVK